MIRGCGKRDRDSLYICVETSPFGQPIEAFLVDPALRWKGGQLRAPMLVEDPHGIHHVLLGIGKTYYPYVPDFVEEARVMGVSKKVPRNFEVERLTRGKSKLLLIHPRAIPNFSYEAHHTCPKRKRSNHECIGMLWPLSALTDYGEVHSLEEQEDDKVKVSTPSCTYVVRRPIYPIQDGKYSSGIILSFPKFDFEWVNKEGKIPTSLKGRYKKWELKVVPE